jgi:hypothetical protein
MMYIILFFSFFSSQMDFSFSSVFTVSIRIFRLLSSLSIDAINSTDFFAINHYLSSLVSILSSELVIESDQVATRSHSI